MSLKETLYLYKDRYHKTEGDVRYLKKAILRIAEEHRNDPDYEEYFSWIMDGINAEFAHKSETQEMKEQIGALVTYLVHNGASVKSAFQTVAEWLVMAETKVRGAYCKIKNTYGVDPKNATYYDLSQFFSEHEETPLNFIRMQSDKRKPFPRANSQGNGRHSKVQKAMNLACDLAQYHKIKRNEFEEDAVWQRQLEHQDEYQNW